MEELLRALKRPALWERSVSPFWDDDHISKGMLRAHLDPLFDAASRKRETIERSVSWLSQVLPTGGRVLDLGCGPGLYDKKLSDRGFSVTGMDLSRRSIEYAKAHDAKTEYVLHNYLAMDIERAFDGAIMIYCDYGALTAPERAALLKNVRRALMPGGTFLFDVFGDRRYENLSETTSWSVSADGGFFSDKPHVLLEAKYLYGNGVSADKHVVLTGQKITEHIIWDTTFTLERLKEEVELFGFSLERAWDDACGSDYTGASDTLCVMIKRT